MAKKVVTPAIRTVDEDTGEVIVTPEVSIEEATPAEVAKAMEKTIPFFKTPFNHNTDYESHRTGTEINQPTKTQQHLASETEISNILAKFTQTGELPNTGAPIYQDFAEEFDLQTNMVTSWEVEQAWNNLPAAVRNILKDPKTFVSYIDHCVEKGDLGPLRELGLAKAMEPPKTDPAAPITPGGGTPAPQSAQTPPAASQETKAGGKSDGPK